MYSWWQFQVAWIKSDSKAILAIHTHMVAHNQRLSVTHNGHNTWKLHVSNVQKNDSGTYMCQINTDPMRSQVWMRYLLITLLSTFIVILTVKCSLISESILYNVFIVSKSNFWITQYFCTTQNACSFTTMHNSKLM